MQCLSVLFEDIYSEVDQRPLAAIEEGSLFTAVVSKVENVFVVSSSTSFSKELCS